MTFKSILPPNATPLELATEQVTGERIATLSVPIKDMWNPETCPETHLPWLAWALSVDVWDNTWSEAIKRSVIAKALQVHALKGTRGALDKALSAQGFGVAIREWWQTSPQGSPNTYTATLTVTERPLNDKEIILAERTFNVTKRYSQHGTLSFVLQPTTNPVHTASAVVSGVTTTVYPS